MLKTRRPLGLNKNWLTARGVLPFAGVLLLLAIACSSSPTETPLPGGPDVSVVLVTTDMSVGTNRVVFGLIDREGSPIRGEEAQVQALLIQQGGGTAEVKATTTAKFTRWPTGNQGVFITSLDFDTPGFWGLQVQTLKEDGSPVDASGLFEVKATSSTPAIGSPAPASVTPTSAQVDDLATISSSIVPDPDLYQISVHDALTAGKPTVVVFATPAFCVSATCGPQVAVLSQVKDQLGAQANFIHVEVFKDPHLIQENRPTTGFVPSVEEWGLPTEPWTFVMDKDGLVQAKFEQFTTAEEIANALEELL